MDGSTSGSCSMVYARSDVEDESFPTILSVEYWLTYGILMVKFLARCVLGEKLVTAEMSLRVLLPVSSLIWDYRDRLPTSCIVQSSCITPPSVTHMDRS